MIFYITKVKASKNNYWVTTYPLKLEDLNNLVYIKRNNKDEFFKIMDEETFLDEFVFDKNKHIKVSDWNWDEQPIMKMELYAY